ncbi:MAG: endolytic transglycosylase MltG [Clostridia bacterium]|nr:endolytic transglycosylase MltG [Clostridia bacterium]
MKNNDTGKGRFGNSDEFEQLLKRYEVSNSEQNIMPEPTSEPNHQQQEKLNLSKFFDDDLTSPSYNPSAEEDSYEHIDDDKAPRYNGEIYFSDRTNTNNLQGESFSNNSINTRPSQRNANGKKSKNNMTKEEKKSVAIYIAILFAISIALSAWTMSCINDILAFSGDNKVITVTVPEKAETGQIIKILDKEGLIKNGLFCRSFMSFTLGLREANPEYLAGVYYLRPDMGVEKMLTEMQETKEAKTITLSFPEGWTIDKIAERLMKNDVCTTQAFYENLDQAMFDYDFVNEVKGEKDKYHNLEGYLFPDTYEFFVGDNPSNVIRTMLKRFDEEWTDEYDARAKELGMSVDEVITLASIIQKEAGSQEQMKYISSVFHNRLNNPSNFPSLQSDATASYVTNCIRYGVDSSQYDTYLLRYNTYNLTGLPVGAICNPGAKAIEAALYPADTDYYYFCHNTETKELYLAKTLMEHNQNKIKAELTSTD